MPRPENIIDKSQNFVGVAQVHPQEFWIGFSFVTIAIICLFVAVFFLYKKQQKTNKQGFIFENQVRKNVKEIAKANKSFYLEGTKYNIDGQLCEVDDLIVTEYGMIVLEYKSYFGHVSGDSYEKMYLSSKKTKQKVITNFILQNEKHIDHFSKLVRRRIKNDTDFNRKDFFASVIVLGGDSTFDVHNVPSHVFLANEQNLEEKIQQAYKYLKATSLKIEDVKNFASMIRTHEASTINEKKTFLKMIKAK
ncbi:nuclease-related domain-containing protein [Mycoplasmopsis ciconiae]|uniref:Nuclease-related domain-containing protein n=1 Tax=Mycoplasmopsis ciconiae TaxID=561067 RepID=A0ABU7MKT3_9BACT|nr:nuclease-related domain-containing protein [Mycoplasmopsis ciconiae]